jgi:hypothetical protein
LDSDHAVGQHDRYPFFKLTQVHGRPALGQKHEVTQQAQEL